MQNGINALEACNLVMAGINALGTQHLEPDVRSPLYGDERRNGSEYRSGPTSMADFSEGRPEGLSGGSNRKGIELRQGGAALMTSAKFSFKRRKMRTLI